MASTNTLGTPWRVSGPLFEPIVALVARWNRDLELTDLGLARADIRTIAKRAADEV